MAKNAIRIRAGKAALLACLCCSALPAHAATVSVDCDAGKTITAALDNVKPGDTVLVSGTCNEQVSFAPEMVRITLDGQKKTTIQHPGKGAPSAVTSASAPLIAIVVSASKRRRKLPSVISSAAADFGLPTSRLAARSAK